MIPPRMLSFRFFANSSKFPVSFIIATRMAAIPAIARGRTLFVKNVNPIPVARMPAINIKVFCRFAPLVTISLNAVIISAAPDTTSPMPAPTLPNVIARPPARATTPARDSSRFFQFTPLFHASDKPSHRRISPPTAMRMPLSFVRIEPSAPGSPLATFHKARPAAISKTASAIFLSLSLISSM